MALITQADIEARLGRSLTADESSSFTLINLALQSHVERMIGSSIESVSPTTRYYDGGVQHLAIDPCTSITALKYVDDDTDVEYTFISSDYTSEPVNKTLKTMLRNRDGKFVTGINNIAVTAKFSIYEDTNTLNIVKSALLESLVSEISNNDNIQRESIEGYSVDYVTDQTKDNLSAIKFLFPGV